MLAFYAITNLHLLNIVNVKNIYFPNEDADLYIAMSDRLSPTLINAIINLKLFNRIEYLPASEKGKIELFNQTHYLRLIIRFFEVIVSNYKSSQILTQKIGKIHYNHLFINDFGGSQICMMNYLNKYHHSFRISIIEEGAGVLYSNKDKIFFLSIQDRIFFTLFQLLTLNLVKKDVYIRRTNAIYVYKPQLYCSDAHLAPEMIPEINHSNNLVKKLLENEVQSLDISAYLERRYYYFASSEVMRDSYTTTTLHINTLLSVIPENQLIIKDHPRFTNTELASSAYDQYLPNTYVDQRNYLLESIFSQINLDDKVLITRNSASVLHPKYMFGKEPYVLFTYKLYADNYTNIDKFASDLKLSYNNKEKIMVPENIEEMKKMLQNIT